MSSSIVPVSRRLILGSAALALFTPGAFAEELVKTPKQTEGPFYP
ncbi:MAG: intradiol ring-cleavage dioxygenase, partial [Planctomycetia bacterium]|nr:intradiol ring-cleavage dioxygenase [Planctomycetia bacterium]